MFVYVDELYWTVILFSMDIALEVGLCLLIMVMDNWISNIKLIVVNLVGNVYN
jgi:hypothetical protein